MIRLESPWSLLVLVLFAFVALRLRAFPPGARLRRAVAWLALCLALAGPVFVGHGGPEPIALALDLSSSTSHTLPAALARLRTAVHRLPPTVPVSVVAFGARAVVAAPASTPAAAASWLDRLAARHHPGLGAVGQEETDIEGALRLAAWTLPAARGGRVILVSDGRETHGDARGAAAALALRGTAVDTVELEGLASGVVDAGVGDLDAPAQVQADAAFEIEAPVRSTRAGSASAVLLRDGREIDRRAVHVSRAGERVRFLTVSTTPGEHRYGVRVVLEGDVEKRNDVAETSVVVVGPPRVLWLGEAPALASTSVLEIVALSRETDSRARVPLEDFDAVVLADIESDALPAGVRDGLQTYVGRHGGGLVMLGARRSFGPGGYWRTPIEEALPVTTDADGQRRRPRLALVLAVDKSGSMAESFGTTSKLAAARQAALTATTLLESNDRLGIVAFDSTATALLPPSDPSVSEIPGVLDQLRAGGGTRLAPSLAAARSMLQPFEGWRRHVVLLTDGRGEGPEPLTAAVRELAARGITLSVVAVGDDADATVLRSLAEHGGGRFVVTRDVGQLAGALRREATVAHGEQVTEGRAAVIAEPDPVLAGLGRGAIPPVLGRVAVTPRSGTRVPLRTADGAPLLVLGTFGLGRTAALATDPAGPWGAEWRSWRGRATLLSSLLRWVARAPAAPQLALEEETHRSETWLVARLHDGDGDALNGRRLVARVQVAGAPEAPVTLGQRGIGEYAGRLPSASRQLVVVEEQLDDGTRRFIGRGWVGLSYPDEYRLLPRDRALLGDVRRVSDGRAIDDAASLDVSFRSPQPIPMWPALALLALGSFVLELVWGGRPRLQVPRT